MPSLAALLQGGTPYDKYLAQSSANRQEGAQNDLRSLQMAQGAGSLMQMIQQQEKAKRDMQIAEQYRTGMAGAKTDEEKAALAAKAVGPQGYLTYAEKMTRDAATKEMARARLAQTLQIATMQHQDRMAKAPNEAARMAETVRHNQMIEAIQRDALQNTGARLAYDTGTPGAGSANALAASAPATPAMPAQPTDASGPVDFRFQTPTGITSGTAPNDAAAGVQAKAALGIRGEFTPPVGAPAPVAAPVPAPATQQTPSAPAASAIPAMPPEIAKLPRKQQDAWTLAQGKSAGMTIKGDSLASAGAMVASGMPLSQAVPGFGAAYMQSRNDVRDEAIRQIKAQNPGMSNEAAGQELANRNIDFVAGKSSVRQLNKMLVATRQAIDQLEFNVKAVSTAMDKLGGGGVKDISPVINAIARGASKWTGDPAYSELFYYMYAAATESARILSGGQASIAQLYEGARKEAEQWASANMTTPKAWREGVAPSIIAEGKERINTFTRAIEKQRIGGNQGAGTPPTTGQTSTPSQQLNDLQVQLPNGKILSFPDANRAKMYRKAAGL